MMKMKTKAKIFLQKNKVKIIVKLYLRKINFDNLNESKNPIRFSSLAKSKKLNPLKCFPKNLKNSPIKIHFIHQKLHPTR